jgi:hypothetical protein
MTQFKPMYDAGPVEGKDLSLWTVERTLPKEKLDQDASPG